jgi:protein-S-isoprenylcysteine O-methyltransferase Ste14
VRPLVFHDWRAIAATVTTLGACAIVMRTMWRSRPRIAASGPDRRHLDRYTRGLGVVHVLALGEALRGWAISTLGDWFQGALVVQDDQRLVESGPYRLIRHPAYAGGIVRAAGLGLVLDNWLSLALLIAGMTAFVAVRIRREEAVLIGGLEPYATYRRRTARLLPGIW